MGGLPAHSLAVDPTNSTALDAQLPEVDAIIATSASNSSKIITFSSATDPGAHCLPPPSPVSKHLHIYETQSKY